MLQFVRADFFFRRRKVAFKTQVENLEETVSKVRWIRVGVLVPVQDALQTLDRPFDSRRHYPYRMGITLRLGGWPAKQMRHAFSNELAGQAAPAERKNLASACAATSRDYPEGGSTNRCNVATDLICGLAGPLREFRL